MLRPATSRILSLPSLSFRVMHALLIPAVFGVALILSAAASRGEESGPIVVELFTSQGCSSCPPADAFFHSDLSNREDVIALALHVDYWDYIGWKDVFAHPRNTQRQKAYATAAGQRSVYTPQMIIGGRDHVVGNHPYEVTDLIRKHKTVPAQTRVTLDRKGDRLRIRAAAADNPRPMMVHLVRYNPVAQVEVRRGENAGRTLTYSNIVEDWKVLREWNAKRALDMNITVRGKAPIVVLIQEKGHGPVVSAARLR